MTLKHYWEAAATIPAGETRTYRELALLAGEPGGARAAGRALSVSVCGPRSKVPWHRVVRTDGRPKPSDREALQWRRLRLEGARPKATETITEWAQRVGAALVGNYPTREIAATAELEALRWSAERVEPFTDEATALSRGFRTLGASAALSVPLPSPSAPTASRARVDPPAGRLLSRLEKRRDDFRAAVSRLAVEGAARVEALLTPHECRSILAESSAASRYERSTEMAPKGYGVGAYHYYREPLPEPLTTLRRFLYETLAPAGLPSTLDAFWERCRERGQKRAASILIGYPKGGINHLHRDIYGPVAFPYQALVMLSKRGRDFTGGEFLLERGGELREYPVSQGDLLIFESRPQRHGMRMVQSGTRYGVGLVFHLAE